jgi:hypothetical protein
VRAFSADGKYAAATNSPTGGDFSEVAILDASDGRVVAQHSLLESGGGISMEGTPIFDRKGDLLFVGADPETGERAILRLTHDAVLSRATGAVRQEPGATGHALVLATGP